MHQKPLQCLRNSGNIALLTQYHYFTFMSLYVCVYESFTKFLQDGLKLCPILNGKEQEGD